MGALRGGRMTVVVDRDQEILRHTKQLFPFLSPLAFFIAPQSRERIFLYSRERKRFVARSDTFLRAPISLAWVSSTVRA